MCIACVLTWQSLWDTVDLAIAVAAPQILLPCVAQCVGGTFHWLTPAGAHGTPWYPQITLLFQILIYLCLNFELDKGIIYRKPSLLYRVKLHAFLRVNQSTKMHRTASIGYFRGKHWQVTSIVWSNKSVNPPWFGTFSIFLFKYICIYIYIGNNNLIWLIFFRGVETTNGRHNIEGMGLQ